MKDIQKSQYFGEVICEWSSVGDMWTINNFHLGLKLCEATSHMAGQRESERSFVEQFLSLLSLHCIPEIHGLHYKCDTCRRQPSKSAVVNDW